MNVSQGEKAKQVAMMVDFKYAGNLEPAMYKLCTYV